VPEGPVAFYQIDRANRPAGLIQDQPRAFFTDFLMIKISIKITACRRKIENKQTKKNNNKDKGMGRKQTTPPRPSPPRQVGSYPGADRPTSIQNSKE